MNAKNILIGWASRDVTPEGPVTLRGQFQMRISTGAKDPVTLTALSISNAEDSFIWISVDTVAVPSAVLAECREKLKQALPDFNPEKLIMNATHTHTAPSLQGEWHPEPPPGVMTIDEYKNFFIEKAVDAAVESWKTRKTGSVSWGYGYAVVGHNRRAVYFHDRPAGAPGFATVKNAQMYGKMDDPDFDCMEGYVDHSVNILFTYNEKKELTGSVINIPCPSQETESLSEISADFWNETREALRKKYGKKLFILPQCSAAGDISPHLRYNQKAEQRMLELKGIDSRHEIAERISEAFDKIYKLSSKDIRNELVLKHNISTVRIQKRLITGEECAAAKAGLAELEKIAPSDKEDSMERLWADSVLFARKYRCRTVMERYEKQSKEPLVPVEIHAIRIGDIVMANNPFELFLDYGIRIIARSPAVQTFLVQLSPGAPVSDTAAGMGYLPSAKAFEGEHYSACLYCNVVGPEGGQELVEATLKTINELFDKEK